MGRSFGVTRSLNITGYYREFEGVVRMKNYLSRHSRCTGIRDEGSFQSKQDTLYDITTNNTRVFQSCRGSRQDCLFENLVTTRLILSILYTRDWSKDFTEYQLKNP